MPDERTPREWVLVALNRLPARAAAGLRLAWRHAETDTRRADVGALAHLVVAGLDAIGPSIAARPYDAPHDEEDVAHGV